MDVGITSLLTRRMEKISKNAEWARRFVLTAFLYVTFGIGALLVAFLMVIPVAIFCRNKDSRIKIVRWINYKSFNIFSRAGQVLGVFEVSFVNDVNLNNSGQLIIANHPSLLDVVFLLGKIRQANCVVKKDLLFNPFLAIQVYFAGYILNDTGESLLDVCLQRLEQGETIIMFPEGTRTKNNKELKFLRGAAYLMLVSKCAILPIHISCDPLAIGKNDPWYHVPDKKISFLFTVLKHIPMEMIRTENTMKLPLKSRRLTKALSEWYGKLNTTGCDLSDVDLNLSPLISKL